MKQKFCQKNFKFAKHDENCATHYSLIVQSFAPKYTSSRSREKFLWVHHGDRSPGTTRQTEFRKKTFHETLRNTFYTLFTLHINFVVSSWFHCGSQIVCSPLNIIAVCNSRIWNPVGVRYSFSWNTLKSEDPIFVNATNPYFPTFITIKVPVILMCWNSWINFIYIIIYEIFV